MSKHLVNDNKYNKHINSLCDIDGYEFDPKIEGDQYIKVTKVNLVDKTLTDKLLSSNFERYFRRLVALAMSVIDDDDSTDDDADIVLDEAELVKQILENRYRKYIGYEKEQLFLKKVRIIENQIQMKKIEIKKKAIYLEMQERMNRTRGM